MSAAETCRVEPVAATAVRLLAALHRACFAEDPWNADALAVILAIPGTWARIVLREDHQPAGFILVRDLGLGRSDPADFPPECEILSFGVIPASRRDGLGRILLESALADAAQHGNRSAVLEVALANIAARALYAAAGFETVGRRRLYYNNGDDALILRLSFDS